MTLFPIISQHVCIRGLKSFVALRPCQQKLFFATDELEDKELKFLGWKGPVASKKLIDGATKSGKSGKRR